MSRGPDLLEQLQGAFDLLVRWFLFARGAERCDGLACVTGAGVDEAKVFVQIGAGTAIAAERYRLRKLLDSSGPIAGRGRGEREVVKRFGLSGDALLALPLERMQMLPGFCRQNGFVRR